MLILALKNRKSKIKLQRLEDYNKSHKLMVNLRNCNSTFNLFKINANNNQYK